MSGPRSNQRKTSQMRRPGGPSKRSQKEFKERLMGRMYRVSKSPLRKASKPGRNEQCPCGSGKKSKYCCGKAA